MFELPPGAVELLGPRVEGVEAFRAGASAYGLQFHPEVDAGVLEGWYADYGDWLAEAGVAERDARAADAAHRRAQADIAHRLFTAFAGIVTERGRLDAERPPTRTGAGTGRLRVGQAGVGAVSGSCSSFGSQPRRLGRYQLRSPSSFMVAGSRTARMIVASIRIAAARPTPICLAS